MFEGFIKLIDNIYLSNVKQDFDTWEGKIEEANLYEASLSDY